MSTELVDVEVGTPPLGELCIVSWNVNGLRSLNMKEVLTTGLGIKCSILAVQETKLTRGQLEESQALIKNYSSYFSFSKHRAGYSGVASYCTNETTPVRAEDGIAGTNLDSGYKMSSAAVGSYISDIGEQEFTDGKYGDCDGRSVITQHIVFEPDGTEKLLNVINVYCPRLRDDPSDPINNRQFKFRFHDFISRRARNMVDNGQFVLIVGDLNISHQILDQSDVEETKKFVHHEFRQWLGNLLSEDDNGIGFKDTFRLKHPTREKAFTCWNTKLNARQNNYGARIDYILADSKLSKYLKDADVHQSIMGSDHCPVSATFHSLRLQNNTKIPAFASKSYPEFSGKQQTLVDLFKRHEAPALTPDQCLKVQNEPRKRVVQGTKQISLRNFLVKKPKLESSITETSNSEEPPVDAAVVQAPGFFQEINSNASTAWRQLMKTPEIPKCTGHQENCTLRTVKKPGANVGLKFWGCSRGQGKKGDPNSNCDFFKWAVSKL